LIPGVFVNCVVDGELLVKIISKILQKSLNMGKIKSRRGFSLDGFLFEYYKISVE
jgi:hypothetical protein